MTPCPPRVHLIDNVFTNSAHHLMTSCFEIIRFCGNLALGLEHFFLFLSFKSDRLESTLTHSFSSARENRRKNRVRNAKFTCPMSLTNNRFASSRNTLGSPAIIFQILKIETEGSSL